MAKLAQDWVDSDMKSPHPREVPVVRDLPPNLMGEIGRVIFYHSYVEWRLDLIIYDILRTTKVINSLVSKDIRAIDQFDIICDLISLRNDKTDVDLIDLRKSLLLASTQRDMLAHGAWVKDPKTNAYVLYVSGGNSRPVKGKKAQDKRSIKSSAPQYGIEECRLLSELINGIILTIDELYSDTLGEAARSRPNMH
jgi:hypothetical protein